MIRDDCHSTYKLGCIIYLPPCASFMYYLEWKGKTTCGVPDFVLFTDTTPPDTIMDSFPFEETAIDKDDRHHVCPAGTWTVYDNQIPLLLQPF